MNQPTKKLISRSGIQPGTVCLSELIRESEKQPTNDGINQPTTNRFDARFLSTNIGRKLLPLTLFNKAQDNVRKFVQNSATCDRPASRKSSFTDPKPLKFKRVRRSRRRNATHNRDWSKFTRIPLNDKEVKVEGNNSWNKSPIFGYKILIFEQKTVKNVNFWYKMVTFDREIMKNVNQYSSLRRLKPNKFNLMIFLFAETSLKTWTGVILEHPFKISERRLFKDPRAAVIDKDSPPIINHRNSKLSNLV
uniref:Uncharacterized protein n=1 Tax=Romanomermis culicivorax TaxID=13658 RepID=A0A915JIS3_ROMCU